MTIRVVLADDHTVVREGLRLLLESQQGIQVIGEAADGRTAVKLVADLSPDVVVMDVTMPVLNGVEATLQIRTYNPSVQVVILSMHSASEHIYRALRAGARAYLLKEAVGQELVEAIFTVQKGERYLSQKIADHLIDEYLLQRSTVTTQNPLDRLSTREREVLQLVVEGKSSAEIAVSLSLSPKTVDTYRSRLMKKLGVTDLPQLVKFAIRNGLIDLD